MLLHAHVHLQIHTYLYMLPCTITAYPCSTPPALLTNSPMTPNTLCRGQIGMMEQIVEDSKADEDLGGIS